jgi:ABC-type transporter Mla subunit MlaD
LRDEYRATVAEYATVRNERDALRQQRNAFSDDLTATVIRLNDAERELARATRDRDALAETAERLTAERDANRDAFSIVARKCDALHASHALVVAERDALADERDALVARDAKRAERAARGERTFTVEIEPLFFLDERYSARVDVYGDGVTSRTALGIALSKSDTYADAVARACELLALSAHDANPYTPNA